MKKTLFILCALLLTAVGASAQIPYEFHAEDWVTLDTGRLYQGGDSIVYNDDNTITVTPRTDTYSGTNNVALGNSYTRTNTAATISTNGYYITSDQTYFVIVGKDLNTTTGSDYSKLWWMNGYNEGMNVDPDQVVTLTDGSSLVLFAWNISSYTSSMTKDETTGNFILDGWTGGGLTSTGTTATISYIGFCTADEVNASFTIPTNTYVHACTANRNVWTVSPNTYDTWVWLDTNAAKEDGSGMAPPALSYYTTDGEKLPDATITHEPIEGLTPGVYEVSMLIRIIDYDQNDDGTYFTLGPGTTFNATTGTSNAVSQDIYLGVNAHDGSYTETDQSSHEDLYGTYTLYVTVADEGSGTGSLTVSLDIKEATYNWIMFKNLKVKSLGADATPVTVEGTMGAEYGTLILPFDAEISSGITAYTAGEVTTTDGESVLTLTEVSDGKLVAGTPYIIGGTSGSETYKFQGVPTKYEVNYSDGLLTGTLVDMKQENNDFATDGTQYVLQNHTGEEEGGLAFYPITTSSSGVTLDAYHCYLTLDSSTYPSGVRAFISLPGSDEETAIKTIEGAEAEGNGAIYDLSGRKVSKAVKGVYIQNGKKVLVK